MIQSFVYSCFFQAFNLCNEDIETINTMMNCACIFSTFVFFVWLIQENYGLHFLRNPRIESTYGVSLNVYLKHFHFLVRKVNAILIQCIYYMNFLQYYLALTFFTYHISSYGHKYYEENFFGKYLGVLSVCAYYRVFESLLIMFISWIVRLQQ